jgi:hypothetical protein
MGKERKKRGKRGGRQVFLKVLKKEIHSVGEFDPAIAFRRLPLPELLAPNEIVPYYHPTPTIPRRSKLPRRQQPVEKRVARARDTFVPSRIPTRPSPPSIYTRKPPSAIPTKLRIRHNVSVHLKIILKPSWRIQISNVQRKPQRNTNIY